MSFRLRAFLIHLGISFTIAVISLIVVFLVWHPSPLAKAVGVTQIFLLLLVIDAVLGPVLTFLVAKQGKKSLKMDLAIIAILQAFAYCYGMYHIAEGRPVRIAFDTFRFEVVRANAVDHSAVKVSEKYQRTPWLKPEWVAIKPPGNNQEKSDRLFYELSEGFPPSTRPALYEPLADAWPTIKETAHSLSKLEQLNPKLAVAQILEKYPQADGYIPLLAPEVDMTVLINTKEQKIEKIVDLRPWQ
ncbi:hypothetical protein KRX19_00645 [Cardiobacteriaceae bacterium TAE3-ERU3]|nr:hypothetical protein [Cardiobacteriaceae bacterium TAE3-ERU3]